ncbi:hypothetical protein NS234_17775 [Microbacterium oxydans]|uniref:hypothetical protein n=1 Tax=Microbacterium oxydans TaxID=82380 RepID=UPI000734AD12|nr:hypothetical protein [Microbacterium oxydans]KTR74789.1 hypothetical protein NS234_17775 [Microbacterium oxydans]
MYSFVPEQSGGSAQSWGQAFAHRGIGDAITTLEEVGAVLVSLVDATDWSSEGFRALHELLARVRDDTGTQLGSLRIRQWELEGSE